MKGKSGPITYDKAMEMELGHSHSKILVVIDFSNKKIDQQIGSVANFVLLKMVLKKKTIGDPFEEI